MLNSLCIYYFTTEKVPCSTYIHGATTSDQFKNEGNSHWLANSSPSSVYSSSRDSLSDCVCNWQIPFCKFTHPQLNVIRQQANVCSVHAIHTPLYQIKRCGLQYLHINIEWAFNRMLQFIVDQLPTAWFVVTAWFTSLRYYNNVFCLTGC